MKQSFKSIRLLMASAIALVTMVTTAMPAAQAQGDQPPSPTPIPLPEDMTSKSPTLPVPTAEPAAATEQMSPQASDVTIWTPASGVLNINNSGQVTVRVSTSDGDLDASSARFVLAINGVFQTPQVAGATAVGNNATMDLTASGLGAVNTSTTKILFKINRAGGVAVTDSAIYDLSRGGKLFLGNAFRDGTRSNAMLTLTDTGINTCDSLSKVYLHPWIRHNVQNTRGDSWFAALNSLDKATIVVSLTNYTPSFNGQLQIWSGVNGGTACGGSSPSPTYLSLGTNPNPIVVVPNVPAGLVFFRVVSAVDQSNNRPLPAPYIISWGYPTGQSGGSGSEIEPNNNTCQATVLPERAIFTGNDNDQFDFYSISITQSGQIMVYVEGYQTLNAQIQVRAPVGYNGVAEANCQSTIPSGLRKDPYTEPIGTVTTSGAPVLTRSGIVLNGGSNGDNAGTVNPAQTWFIRIATPNATGQSNQPYTIRWVYLPPGVTTYPFSDKLTQSGPAHGNDPLLRVNDPFGANTREKWYYSFFWANLDKGTGGVDTIQFGIDSWTLSGCDPNTFPPDPGRTVPAGFAGGWVTVSNSPSGAMTWKMNKSGAYRFRFRALRAGNVVRADEKAIRVDCGFDTYNYGGLWPMTSQSTTGSPVIGPEKPAGWIEPIP